MKKEDMMESLVQEISFGIILGVIALFALIIAAARSDRRGRDDRKKESETKKDDTTTP